MTVGSGLFSTERGINPAKTVAGKAGLPGEVGDLRRDVGRVLGVLAAIVVEEWTNPIASGAATLRAAAATDDTGPVEVLAAALTTATLDDLALAPRQVVFTTAGVTPAHAPATATITGTDIKGNPLVETVNLAQTAASATSVNAFALIEKIDFPVADGAAATIAIGTAAPIGLSNTPKSRAGAVSIVHEVAAGSVVTNGTLSDAATVGPYGGYAPNAATNGANDYAIFYEYDPTA